MQNIQEDIDELKGIMVNNIGKSETHLQYT